MIRTRVTCCNGLSPKRRLAVSIEFASVDVVVTRILLTVSIILGSAGCIEKREPAASGAASSASQPSSIPAAEESPPSGKIVQDYAKNFSTAPSRAATVIDLSSIQRAINQFQGMEGRYPKSLEELVDQRYLPQLPPVPHDKKLSYDPATGTVSMVDK